MNRILVTLVLLLLMLPVTGQNVCTTYSKAISFLENDKEIVKKIAEWFDIKRKNKIASEVSYVLADSVRFIDIEIFLSKEMESTLSLDGKDSFENQYWHQSEPMPQLLGYKCKTNCLELHFSKRIGNFLPVEITYPNSNLGGVRLGRSLIICLLFTDDGLIEAQLIEPIHNN